MFIIVFLLLGLIIPLSLCQQEFDVYVRYEADSYGGYAFTCRFGENYVFAQAGSICPNSVVNVEGDDLSNCGPFVLTEANPVPFNYSSFCFNGNLTLVRGITQRFHLHLDSATDGYFKRSKTHDTSTDIIGIGDGLTSGSAGGVNNLISITPLLTENGPMYFCSANNTLSSGDYHFVNCVNINFIGGCNEHGTVSSANLYTCDCNFGYTGNHCQTTSIYIYLISFIYLSLSHFFCVLDFCQSNPCMNGATCVNGDGNYTCNCDSNHNGTHCEHLNRCDSGQYINATDGCSFCDPGTYQPSDDIDIYSCSLCPPGKFNNETAATQCNDCDINFFTNISGLSSCYECDPGFYTLDQGSYYCNNTDECASSPCLHGATCLDGANSFMCDCAPGYNGILCQTDINECDSNPCENGGTCLDGVNSFHCSCSLGYSGFMCQTDINECHSNPCSNGGTCIDGLGSFICHCAPGFSGNMCQTDINECGSNPCQNGGTCLDGINGFECDCTQAFTGTLCQTNTNECASSPCQNGASCKDGLDSFVCTCPPGFSGVLCETDINECISTPCQNGGTCIDGTNSFTCHCPIVYEGNLCQTLNYCLSNPCQNGGTCFNHLVNYTCGCDLYHRGDFCEITCNGYANFTAGECQCPASRFGITCQFRTEDSLDEETQTHQKCNSSQWVPFLVPYSNPV